MTDSKRNVPFAHSLHQGPTASFVVATRSEGAQRRFIAQGVLCSGLRPPRYPMQPSGKGQNQYLPDQRSTVRRRREVSSGGAMMSSGTQNNAVPRQIVVQQGPQDDSEEVPPRPVHTTHPSTYHSKHPAEHMTAESDKETLKQAGVHERVEGQMGSTESSAGERERRRYLEEEFSRRLSAWRTEAELRNVREQEREEDPQEFARSDVFTREQHQRPRYWTAARVRKNNRGLADIAVVTKPLFGVKDRLHLSAPVTSCR